jgi:hypothetical protein
VFDGVLPQVGRWLPQAASMAMAGDVAPSALRQHLLSWWLATVVLAAWALVPIVVGSVVTFRRDVS